MTATLERARRTSADHAVLGLDRIFISEAGGVMPERKATPAQGVAADEEALARSAEALTRVAEAMVGEGVVPCLHSHVGTRIETQAEIEYVLDRVPDSTLLLGPDTGHLAWAGTDPGEFIGRHAGRIGAIHIKDMRKSVAEVGRAAGLSYDETTARHLWTEPGRGDVDLDRVLAVIPRFEGWFVVEVDISDQPTVAQSARVAADWLRPRLEMRAI
jgi:inosose dehydratase